MPLKVISLNVDSIVTVGRRNLLADFMDQNPADIYLFQETKLDSRIKLFFPHYNIFRSDVRRGYAGTAIFIRHGIPIRNLSVGTDVVNFTSIEIRVNSQWHRIFSVYVIQSCNDIFSHFSNLFNTNSSILFWEEISILDILLLVTTRTTITVFNYSIVLIYSILI